MFSPLEKQIINMLTGKKKPIGFVTISKKIDTNSMRPETMVSGAVRSINKKCKRHNLNWSIVGQGLGRGGKTVSLVKS